MALPDATEAAPVRRMSVARGTLRPGTMPDARAQGRAEAAAAAAAKQAAFLLPGTHPFHPSHVDVLWDHHGDTVTVTVTVQAYARQVLETAALLGVAAALAEVRDGGKLTLEIVQSV